MAQSDLDELLLRMPAIAEAVEKFTSEAIQSQALEALVKAFQSRGASDAAEGEPNATNPEPEIDLGGAEAKDEAKGGEATPRRAARKTSSSKQKQSFSIDKELDLIRGGPTSFKDFVTAKQPKTATDKVLIAIYWLTRIHNGNEPATLDRVYSCFKHAEWPIPSDLANTTQQAGAKGWLDSRKRDDLKVVIGGENRVEHEMPMELKK